MSTLAPNTTNNKKRDEDGERDIRVADNVPIDGMRYGNESLENGQPNA